MTSVLSFPVFCVRLKQRQMSCVARKQDFCLCENKVADQLRSLQISFAVTAKLISDFVLLHEKNNSSSSKTRNVKLLAIFCSCTGRFVFNLVRNPEGQFSCVAAHVKVHFPPMQVSFYVHICFEVSHDMICAFIFT